MAGQYLPDRGDILIDQRSIYQRPELKQEIFFIDEKKIFPSLYS
ncbi:hypothetical protein [Enterococcus avium]|nr:hypothetical protein [Enterococcus avium]